MTLIDAIIFDTLMFTFAALMLLPAAIALGVMLWVADTLKARLLKSPVTHTPDLTHETLKASTTPLSEDGEDIQRPTHTPSQAPTRRRPDMSTMQQSKSRRRS